MIDLNQLQTSMPKPEPVVQAVANAMTHMGNASRGTHGNALEASMVVYDARRKLAQFFGCPKADHVVFASGGTEALNIAVKGSLSAGDHVITTSKSGCRILDSMGAEISYDFIPPDYSAAELPEKISERIRPDTRMVLCSHTIGITGNLCNLKAVGKVCREHKIRFIADAGETAGAVPIHIEEDLIDILCFSGHRYLFGPQGTGGLCIRPGITIRPLKSGGSGVQSYSKLQPPEYPAHLEAGTLNSHGIAGLSAALSFLLETGTERIRQHDQMLTERFYRNLMTSEKFIFYGDYDSTARMPAVVLNIRGMKAELLIEKLRSEYGIFAGLTGSAACFSFSYFNTEEEIDTVSNILLAIAGWT